MKRIFGPQSELFKPVSPQAAQLGIFVNFTSFIEMHLLEGPDIGHSMNCYDGKFKKKRQKKKKKAQSSAGYEPSTSRSVGELSTAALLLWP